LAKLEGEGFAMQGQFTPRGGDPTVRKAQNKATAGMPANCGQGMPALPGVEWCSRRLLARIHSYTLNRLRKEIEPVSAADFMRFLFVWQKAASDHQVEGAQSVAAILDQLEGFEAPPVPGNQKFCRRGSRLRSGVVGCVVLVRTSNLAASVAAKDFA
jgi:hypothetical protein